MELDIIAAKDFIAGKFRNAGDFDFIPDEQLRIKKEKVYFIAVTTYVIKI